MWSTVEKTALAEAEVEYKEHKSITVWVMFHVKQTENKLLEDASIVIWTTTPWTLPSNRAVAYGADIAYGVYEIKGENKKLVLALSLAGNVKEKAGIEEWTQIGTLTGAELEGTVCAHPLAGQGYDFDVPALAGDFVTEEAGTGFVHIAPGHGLDDFMLVNEYNETLLPEDPFDDSYKEHLIEITDNVTDDGKFREHVPLFAGMEVYTQKGEMGDGNFAVLKELKEAGALLAKGSLRHEYPHSWRSKAPVIFRTTPQWFIGMNVAEVLKPITDTEPGVLEKNLRRKALNAIKKTDWIPAKGQARISAMIENRPDWCISRQRAWGVPIALFVHKDSKEILKDSDVFDRIGTIFEDEGSDSWWSRPASDFLGEKYNADDYEQIFDIVDVWFESGATHAFVLGDTQRWPVFDGVTQADLYLEGSDQHRGWFHSSLLESCGTTGHAPYKAVLTHGFILDDKGYKMSKSAGNVVDPLKLMEEYGADILRLWVMTSDYSEDLRIGKDSLKQTSDLYRRIRNTLRFLLGALEGFTEAEKIKPEDYKEMPELEQFTLHRLYKMDQTIRTCIENYEFSKLTKILHDFCNDDLSAFYFDIRKDRLYCDRPDSFERRACRSVMAEIFCCLSAWLAPLLAFTTEEAWEHRPKNVFEDTESVHLREFPTVPEVWQNEGLVEKWEKISFFRRRVFEQLENMRQNKRIRSSLEARIVGNFSKEYESRFKNVDWAELFIVSDQSMDYNNPEGSLSWTTEEAEGSKCSRCWKILPEVGTQKENLCNRCAEAVDWYQKNRKAA